MADKIDCEFTDEIVCPYCGHEHGDSHEHFERRTTVDVVCDECGKEFRCSQDVTVTYTSSKKEKPKLAELDHDTAAGIDAELGG